MSTRSQVKVIANNKEIMLYHHWDGYPTGVGYCLLKLMEKYKDGEWAEEIINKMIKKADFEVTLANHSDIEYFYEMDFDKRSVSCKSVDNWDGDMKTLEVIDLVYDKEKDCNVDSQLFKGGNND